MKEDTNTPVEPLLTDKQAADLLGVLPRTLRLWRHNLGLPHLKLTGKVIRYRRSELDVWLNRHAVNCRPQ